jgi:hypothetical protein
LIELNNFYSSIKFISKITVQKWLSYVDGVLLTIKIKWVVNCNNIKNSKQIVIKKYQIFTQIKIKQDSTTDDNLWLDGLFISNYKL